MYRAILLAFAHPPPPKEPYEPSKMCWQVFVTYTACEHMRPHPQNPLAKCAVAEGRIFRWPCKVLATTIPYHDSHCPICTADLIARLRIIEEKQARGRWVRTLRKVVMLVSEL